MIVNYDEKHTNTTFYSVILDDNLSTFENDGLLQSKLLCKSCLTSNIMHS